MQVASPPSLAAFSCLARPIRYVGGVKVPTLPLAAALLLAALPHGVTTAQDVEARVEALEKRVAALEAQLGSKTDSSSPDAAAAAVEKNKLAARARARKDTEVYDQDERREIENLYQVANKNWRSPEAIENLEKLISKYDKANRTGCATLYLGQMSEGETGSSTSSARSMTSAIASTSTVARSAATPGSSSPTP